MFSFTNATHQVSAGDGDAEVTAVYTAGGALSTQALLIELLLSGFFAIACFRARATELGGAGMAPRTLFVLTNRLERLRRTRWQWFAVVLLVVLIRLENGTPIVAELTALAQFLLFLALPSEHTPREAVRKP